jgi:hypothetical protein
MTLSRIKAGLQAFSASAGSDEGLGSKGQESRIARLDRPKRSEKECGRPKPSESCPLRSQIVGVNTW